MNNNLEFENEDPSPDSIEDNHPRTNYGEGYYVKETREEAAENYVRNESDATLKLVSILSKMVLNGIKKEGIVRKI